MINAARDAAVIVVYPATAPQSAQTVLSSTGCVIR